MEILAVIGLLVVGFGLYAGFRVASTAYRLWHARLGAKGFLAALASAVYTLSPIDAIPDLLIGIGWVDDLIVLAVTAIYVWRLLSQRQQASTPSSPRPPRPVIIPQLPPR